MTATTLPGSNASPNGSPPALATPWHPSKDAEADLKGRDRQKPYAESCSNIETEILSRLARVGYSWG